MKPENLYPHAQQAQRMAHAPYSKFQVGAAICDEHGQIHSGCNIENAAYPIGCCAEQAAVAQMIVNGGKTIRHILILGKAGQACPPCGACRQILFEHGDANTVVYLEGSDGTFLSRSLAQLLPEAFDHSQLDK